MSTTKKMSIVIYFLLIIALTLSACAPQATPQPAEQPTAPSTEEMPSSEGGAATLPDTIKIGFVDALTGWGAAYGQGSYDGYKLAQKERPTVLGKPVEFIVVDTKSDKSESALAGGRAINDGAVAILGTSGSSWSMALNEVANEAGIPTISNVSTNPLVTQGKPCSFRTAFIDPYQGWAMAKFATEELKAKTAVLLVDIAIDYPVGVANFFRESWFQMHEDRESLLGYFSLLTGDKDYTAQLTTIKDLNPDVVVTPNEYSEVGLILGQARELGLNMPFLGGDGTDLPELQEIAGDAVKNYYLTTHYHPDAFTDENSITWGDRFRKEYNREPDFLAATAEDTYNVLLDAIERAGSVDPQAICAAIAQTKDFHGVTGTISLNETGDAVKPVVVLGFPDGTEKKFITVIYPEEQ